MNNFRWLTKLFNTRRNRQLLNMFGRRRNNRGMMWTSLLGIMASAAAYGIGRNQNNNGMRGFFQRAGKNSGFTNLPQVIPMANRRAYAEFAEEITPNQSPIDDITTDSSLD
ncbi:MAG TPA: hypothetical protein VNM45_06695 [Bacillus sp. (in: firmicutes)]|nr:hypothetical protein [Bacillus sp. (in: firmicutes)]